jgi:hypothetical protein
MEHVDTCKELRGIFNEIKKKNNIASKKECVRILELIPNVGINEFKFMELLKELDRTMAVPLQLVMKINEKTKNLFPDYPQVYAYCMNHKEEPWLNDVKLNVDFNEMIAILGETLMQDIYKES